jgi:hypothetical protein
MFKDLVKEQFVKIAKEGYLKNVLSHFGDNYRFLNMYFVSPGKLFSCKCAVGILKDGERSQKSPVCSELASGVCSELVNLKDEESDHSFTPISDLGTSKDLFSSQQSEVIMDGTTPEDCNNSQSLAVLSDETVKDELTEGSNSGF